MNTRHPGRFFFRLQECLFAVVSETSRRIAEFESGLTNLTAVSGFYWWLLETLKLGPPKTTKTGGNSKICYFHPYLGKIPILTSIFFTGVETTNQLQWNLKIHHWNTAGKASYINLPFIDCTKHQFNGWLVKHGIFAVNRQVV